jgi:DNA-binding protein HU-beta
MTKAELIDIVALESDITKVAAEKALNSFTDNVQKVLKKGDKITLTGFGTWMVGRRKARRGLNPQTKKAISIPACKVPKFKAGKALKAAIR